jgi:hypothetical protein
MTAARWLTIAERCRSQPLSLVDAADFRTSDAGPAQAAELLQQPRLSLYCLDPRAEQALFVDCPDPAALYAQPFLYQAQYEQATRLLAVPFAELHALAAQARVPANRISFLFSVGRCGSTLLSRTLAQQPRLHSLSEPDVYWQLLSLSRKQGLPEAELRQLLKSCTLLLCAASHARGEADAWILKQRSEVTEILDQVHRALPESPLVYLYRGGRGWARSAARAYGLFSPELQAELPHIVQDLADTSPRFARFWAAHPEVELPLLFLAGSWACNLLRCRELQAAGVPLFVTRYEDLLAAPQRVLTALLQACHVPAAAVAAALTLPRQDVQAGTVLSQRDAEHSGSDITEAQFERFAQLIQALAPELSPDTLLPGTFPQ